MSWDDLQQLITLTTLERVHDHVGAHPGHHRYVVGLHGVYREVDGIITLPTVGINSVEAYAGDEPATDDGLGFWSARWDPAQWRWPDVSILDPRLIVAERQLLRLATHGSHDRWIRTEARFWATVAGACRDIYVALAGTTGMSADLIVLLHDRAGGPRLARRAMGDRAFREHFPEHAVRKRERRRVAALPVDEQVGYLLGRLGQLDDEGLAATESAERLARIGAPAIGGLLAHLLDPDVGWQAAMLLGQIGLPTVEVIAALREQVVASRLPSQRAWSASSLAFLGDSGFLVEHADDLPISVATTGTTAPLSPFRDQCLRPPPLDYLAVEQLMDHSNDLATAVTDEIDPRNGVCTISSVEIDCALDGLSSRHDAVRRHAAATLNGRHLSRHAAERVVPALTARLTDADDGVRRSAALSLRIWTESPARPDRRH